MSAPIIGWDMGTGRPVPLPVDQPQEILLSKTSQISPAAPQTNRLRIWGLHPLLVVVVTFYKRLRVDLSPDAEIPLRPENQTGTIHAFPIVKSMHPMVPVGELAELDPTLIFQNGGAFNDGTEINSGMQGIEFLITANLPGPTDYEEVCTIQVKQKNPLGCSDLAQALIDQVKIEVGPALEWS